MKFHQKRGISMNKWIGISLGTLLGVSHIGMIGLLANRSSKMPALNLPVSEYTSYKAKVSMDGYEIEYRANDPRLLTESERSRRKVAFWDWVTTGKALLNKYLLINPFTILKDKENLQTQDRKHVSKQLVEENKQVEWSAQASVLLLLLLVSPLFLMLVGYLLVQLR